MYQAFSCQIWYYKCGRRRWKRFQTKCECFGFLMERNVFVTDGITSWLLHLWRAKQVFLLWPCTVKPSLLIIQKPVPKLQPKKNVNFLILMARLVINHSPVSVSSDLIKSFACELHSGVTCFAIPSYNCLHTHITFVKSKSGIHELFRFCLSVFWKFFVFVFFVFK